MDNFISVLKKFSDFHSKASRQEYWMFVLFNIVFSSIASIINPQLSLLYSLVVFIPALAVTVRRLNDIGKSGWMLLILFIPLIGPIWLLILLLQKGESHKVYSNYGGENSQKFTESNKPCCSNDENEIKTSDRQKEMVKDLVEKGKADPNDPKLKKYLNEEELNENVDLKISDLNKNEDDDSLPNLEDGFK
tara:strand:- start:160 stop:732 length:573 start_codon:yes stop_codon:yes gene_type:complete